MTGAILTFEQSEKAKEVKFTLREIHLNNNIGHNIDFPVTLRKHETKNPNDPIKTQDVVKFVLIWTTLTKHMYNIKLIQFTVNKLQLYLEEEYLEELTHLLSVTLSGNRTENLLNKTINWADFHNSVDHITVKRHFISTDQLLGFLYD